MLSFLEKNAGKILNGKYSNLKFQKSENFGSNSVWVIGQNRGFLRKKKSKSPLEAGTFFEITSKAKCPDKPSRGVAKLYFETTSEAKCPDKPWSGQAKLFFETTSEAKCPDKPRSGIAKYGGLLLNARAKRSAPKSHSRTSKSRSRMSAEGACT